MNIPKVGIIGGGPAALATAIKLKQLNCNVVVFESSNYDTITVGEHLAAEVVHEFKKLNIPLAILTENSIPCTEVQSAWGGNTLHFNESIFNPFGNGYILSRPAFDSALFKFCTQIGITAKIGTRVSKIAQTKTGWELHYNKQSMQVDFIVDACGRNSKFFTDKNQQNEDTLIGITNHLKPIHKTQITNSFLLIEPTQEGWWYSVQNATNNLICTFMTDAKIWQKNKGNKDLFIQKQLNNTVHTKKRVAYFKTNNNYTIQSAHSKLDNQIVGKNWLKVGDAAQSFDPLSSAGIIKGIKTGQLAADSIYTYLNNNKFALNNYKTTLQKQFKEYLNNRAIYYNKEQRWTYAPFWYHRKSIKKIKTFTILPINTFTITEDFFVDKISYLEKQLPEIDFKTLIYSIKKHPLIKDAIHDYCTRITDNKINPWLFYALEGLKSLQIIK